MISTEIIEFVFVTLILNDFAILLGILLFDFLGGKK